VRVSPPGIAGGALRGGHHGDAHAPPGGGLRVRRVVRRLPGQRPLRAHAVGQRDGDGGVPPRAALVHPHAERTRAGLGRRAARRRRGGDRSASGRFGRAGRGHGGRAHGPAGPRLRVPGLERRVRRHGAVHYRRARPRRRQRHVRAGAAGLPPDAERDGRARAHRGGGGWRRGGVAAVGRRWHVSAGRGRAPDRRPVADAPLRRLGGGVHHHQRRVRRCGGCRPHGDRPVRGAGLHAHGERADGGRRHGAGDGRRGDRRPAAERRGRLLPAGDAGAADGAPRSRDSARQPLAH